MHSLSTHVPTIPSAASHLNVVSPGTSHVNSHRARFQLLMLHHCCWVVQGGEEQLAMLGYSQGSAVLILLLAQQ